MIVKIVRDEEKELRTEFYSGEKIVVTDENVEIDGKNILLTDFDAVDTEDNEVHSSVVEAYLMNENGKTIEKIK